MPCSLLKGIDRLEEHAASSFMVNEGIDTRKEGKEMGLQSSRLGTWCHIPKQINLLENIYVNMLPHTHLQEN